MLRVQMREQDEQGRQAELEREEKKKRDLLKKETAMNDFLDKGGFGTVLNNIFNPPELQAMELDSVF